MNSPAPPSEISELSLSTTNPPFLTKKEKHIVNAQREINWLKKQIEQLETDIQDASNPSPIIPDEANDDHVQESIPLYQSHIDQMRAQLEVISLFSQTREQIVKSIDAEHFTLKSLYPERADYLEMEHQKLIESKVNQRDELVVEFSEVLKEYDTVAEELTMMQSQVIQQHVENRKMVLEEERIKEEKREKLLSSKPFLTELAKTINIEMKNMATVRGILNGIILESGVDWFNDPRWSETIMRLGTCEDIDTTILGDFSKDDELDEESQNDMFIEQLTQHTIGMHIVQEGDSEEEEDYEEEEEEEKEEEEEDS